MTTTTGTSHTDGAEVGRRTEAMTEAVTISTHHKSSPDCGATGPIAYEKGKAYSVNTIGGKVVDWRFGLHELPTGCKECQRHIDAAKQTAEDTPFRDAWGSRSTPPADIITEGGHV